MWSVAILLRDLVADVFVLGKLFGVWQPFRKRFRFRSLDGNSDCSMRKQTIRSLFAFALSMPIAFRVVHVGALCMAFCTLSLRVLDAYFLRILSTGTPSRRGTPSANNITVGRACGRSSSCPFVTITAFSFALRFQICNSSAVSSEPYGSELVSLTKAYAHCISIFGNRPST